MFYIWKQEFRTTFRDQGVLIFFILVPLIYPLIYAFIYTNETIREVPTVVVDESRSSLSREYLRRVDATPEVSIVSHCADMAEAKLEHYFDRDVSLDVHAGYRRISTYSKAYRWDYVPEIGEGAWTFDGWDEYKANFFSVGVGSTKYWEHISLGGKVDGFFASSDVYVNAAVQFKYYPLNDGRTSIIVTGSAGTAPEANIIDNAMPGTFDKLNTSVGLGGIYMINKHLSAGLMGTWNTFYSQLNNRDGELMNYSETITTRYRNLYNIHLQLYVHF